MSVLTGDPERLTLDLSDIEVVSRVARALSVPKRLEILRLLGEKKVMSVNEIAQELGIPLSSASVHIGILEEAKLIICERIQYSWHDENVQLHKRKYSLSSLQGSAASHEAVYTVNAHRRVQPGGIHQ